MSASTEPRGGAPPSVEFPRDYNAALHFVDRNVREGRGDETAVIDAGGSYSYAELLSRVNRAGVGRSSSPSFRAP